MQARKALQALKGLVMLQGLVRGQIVRRQAITKLKCLPSTANTRAQVNIGGVLTTEETYKDGNNRKFLRPKKECGGREIKVGEKKPNQASSSNSCGCWITFHCFFYSGLCY